MNCMNMSREAKHLRQMIEVVVGWTRPDCDPVHLVVQTVQQEAQKLLSILLAERKPQIFISPERIRKLLIKKNRGAKLTYSPQIWVQISGSAF